MKLKKPTRGSVTSCWLSSRLSITSAWHHACGKPASCRSAVKRRQDSGVSVAGLTMTGQPAAMAGTDLVHDQVERVVEGAHRHHHPDRLMLGERDPARRGTVEAHRHDVAGFRAQQLGAVQHAIDGARHLDPGIDQRLAALVRRLTRQVLRLLLHQPGRLAQNLDPRGRRQPGITVPEQPVGRGERRLDLLRTAGRNGADQLPVIGRPHLDLGHASHSVATPMPRGTRFFSSSTSTRMFSE